MPQKKRVDNKRQISFAFSFETKFSSTVDSGRPKIISIEQKICEKRVELKADAINRLLDLSKELP